MRPTREWLASVEQSCCIHFAGMRLPDSFSFRQRPRGVFKVLLSAPTLLYRAHLGFLLGDRIILVSHVGRNSGRRYQTPLEVVIHDRQVGEYVVSSGTGPRADWYRNLQSAPAPEVQVGNDRWVPRQRFLSREEAAAAFAAYERARPATARGLLELMGNSYDDTDAGRIAMMYEMPMVAFSDGMLRIRGRSEVFRRWRPSRHAGILQPK